MCVFIKCLLLFEEFIKAYERFCLLAIAAFATPIVDWIRPTLVLCIKKEYTQCSFLFEQCGFVRALSRIKWVYLKSLEIKLMM